MLECGLESILGDVDTDALPGGIVDLSGNLTDLVTDLKTRPRGRRVHPKLGTMHFQPEPLRTLSVGDDLGFGESRHRVILHTEMAYWSSHDSTAMRVIAETFVLPRASSSPIRQSPSSPLTMDRVARSGLRTR